ncbi:hypothetical protein H7X46_01130 [Pseudonocardia sp. C8]|uniref:hypothetical protein n=1 Tax=Pseudonocardia sp. C8 TaxID=2762759 RepID=UPI0016434ECC|nr:hypothetical protein [Pseudonocardia sp. C8]MBC3189668.1 hypothetical protein [Pseudonocardia sp. C8]
MSAPVVRIPSPRRPLGPTARDGASVPTPRVTTEGRHRMAPPRSDEPGSAGRPAAAAGRHRRPAPPCTPFTRTFTVLARAGSLTTLAAMAVLATAVAGLADGTAPTGAAAGVGISSLHR